MLFINFLMIKDTTFGKTMKDLDFNQCSPDGLTKSILLTIGQALKSYQRRPSRSCD